MSSGFTNGALVVGDPSTSRTNLGVTGLNASITESTTARTLGVGDANSIILCSNTGGTTTITIPTNASAAIPVLSEIFIINNSLNAGVWQQINFTISGGVTVPYTPSVGANGTVRLKKIGTDTWLVRQYSSGTHTTNWSGIWAAAQAGNTPFTLIDTTVTLQIPTIQTTANTAASITNVTAFPTFLRPSINLNGYFSIMNNSVNADGKFVINTTGTCSFFNGQFGNFTNTGVGGPNAGIIPYKI